MRGKKGGEERRSVIEREREERCWQGWRKRENTGREW